MMKAGNILFAIAGTFILADIRITQGRLREALQTYKESLQLAANEGMPLLSGAEDLYRGLSEIHFEQGDWEAARHNLKKSEELSEPAMVYQYRLCIAQSRMKDAQGNHDIALALLDEAEQLQYRTVLPDVHPVSALKARVWIRQGRLDDAQEWVRERDLSVDDDLSYLSEFEHITLARVLIAQYERTWEKGFKKDVLGLLERLLYAAEEGGRMGSVIEILVLQAIALEMQGDISPALASLELALKLAEPEGFVRIFVDEGPRMAHLLYAALSHEIAPDYVQRLLAAFPDDEPAKADPSHMRTSKPELVEPLSERELDVLRLLAEDLKYKQIAEQLVVSVNTVRHHTKNIYGKLDVNNRTLAVQKARQYNLL
jgi:LuxR family maltose regulon positive regulatory protein